jgi:thiamine pyrophosphate-dependent acetolactate synthase large subunit-like protein
MFWTEDSGDMAGKTGNAKIIEQFLADGMNVMFGNPGTVEQGFLDQLRNYPEMRYFLTLQESIAVLTADGYARASQKPTLVQLHSSPGIGNAVGALYQAKRGHSPLVVIGGDAGVKYMNMDAQMANDLVAMMAPVTKYATIVLDPRSLLRTLRRAIKIAGTAPMGPVYVCLPMDVLDQINHEEVLPTLIPSTRTAPDRSDIKVIAAGLLKAKNPVFYIGDGVAYSNATKELGDLATLIGAPVYGVEFGDFIMDTTHPLYQGTTGHMFGSYSKEITQKGDYNLIVGTYMLPEVFPELGEVFHPDATVVHIDLNAYEIAKNHRVDIGIVSDPKMTITALIAEVMLIQSADFKSKAESRLKVFAEIKKQAHQKELALDNMLDKDGPIQMPMFTQILAKKLPQDYVIFDEALTNSPAITRYIPPKTPGDIFYTRGGSLGIGIPGAIGAKLASPEKLVIGFTGDGGSMYTIQALWSAVRHKTNAKFVVCNNGAYKLLDLNIDHYWEEQGIEKHDFPLPFDLSFPALNFAEIAASMGVESVRVETHDQIESAVDRMIAFDGPFLIDLVLKSESNPEIVHHTCRA